MTSPQTAPHIGAPYLRAADLQEELERVFAERRRSMLIAFYGTGDPGILSLRSGQRFDVIPTACELMLREQLPPPGERVSPSGDGCVYLVDWATQLPLDIACRLASGRLRHLARESRIAGIFGAYQVSSGLVQSALSRVLFKHTTPQPIQKVTAQVLQRPDAYRRVMQAQFDVPLDRSADAASLIGWCAWQDRGGRALRHLSETDEDWAALRTEIRDFIKDYLGPVAQAAWIAWEYEAGWRFAAVCVVIEAWWEVSQSRPDVLSYGQALLKGHLSQDLWGQTLLDAAAELARQGWVDAALTPPPGARPLHSVEELLASAQTLIKDQHFEQQVLSRSRRLPLGYETRRRTLAQALTALVETPTKEALRVAIAAWQALKSHQIADTSNVEVTQRLEMGLRLAAYIVERASRPQQLLGGPAYRETLELADIYAREGGYVDRARAALRVLDDRDELGDVMRLVLGRVNALRNEDDKRFAQGLRAWLDAGRPDLPQVAYTAPLESLAQGWVEPFLKEKEKTHRKLLVVMLRGLSSAEAVDLQKLLDEEPDRWQDLSWRPDKYKNQKWVPAILCPWPTDAEASLNLFFEYPATETATTRRGEVWTRQQATRLPTQEDAPPQLWGETETSGILDKLGNVNGDILKAIQSEARLLGVILGRQQWQASEMKHLRDLLLAASAGDRAVLVVSDQGWIPGWRAQQSQHQAADSGGRWRARRRASDRATASEIQLPTPSGGEAFVLWDSTRCHGSSVEGGERAWGGASLAEVVVPMLWLASQRLSASVAGGKDGALGTRLFEMPTWWKLPLLLAIPSQQHTPHTAQGELFANALAVAQPKISAAKAPLGSDGPQRVAERLAASESFKQHIKVAGVSAEHVKMALNVVEILEAAGWVLDSERFADRVGELPHRLSGWLGPVRKALVRDGYAALQFDQPNRQIRIHIDILKQLFELS